MLCANNICFVQGSPQWGNPTPSDPCPPRVFISDFPKGRGAEFKAFGMDVSLKMEKNKLLMSRMANIAYVGVDGKAEMGMNKHSTVTCCIEVRTCWQLSPVAMMSSFLDSTLLKKTLLKYHR